MWYHIWFPMLLKFKSLSTDSGDICFKKSIGRRQASFPFPFYLTKTFHFPAKYKQKNCLLPPAFTIAGQQKALYKENEPHQNIFRTPSGVFFYFQKNKKIPLLPASLSQFHSWPDNKRLYIIEKALTTHILSDTAGVFLFTSISILLFIQPEQIKTTKA